MYDADNKTKENMWGGDKFFIKGDIRGALQISYLNLTIMLKS